MNQRQQYTNSRLSNMVRDILAKREYTDKIDGAPMTNQTIMIKKQDMPQELQDGLNDLDFAKFKSVIDRAIFEVLAVRHGSRLVQDLAKAGRIKWQIV